MPEMSFPAEPTDNSAAAEKARSLPQKPGVYLMKDAAGRVIYVGKAKNLRARAASYFHKAAAEDPRTARLVQEIRDLDYLEADSEVDALLMEARLIKDILPKFNRELRDDKTFPYLEIYTHEDFPRVAITRDAARTGHAALRPVRQLARPARRGAGAAEDIQVPHLRAGHPGRRPALAVVPPLPAGLDPPVYGPLQPADLEGRVPQGHPAGCKQFLEGKKQSLLVEMREEMAAASAALRFEEAARLRDEIHLLETLDERGDLETHVQPEVFPVDPKKGLAGLQKVLRLPQPPRTIEGVDIAHTARQRDRGQPWCSSSTACPSSRATGGCGSAPSRACDDFASHPRGRLRGGSSSRSESEVVPDMLLIDGGKGQLHAALAALSAARPGPPTVVALAKREELLFVAGDDEPLRLSRHSYALAAAAIRAGRGPPLRPALPPHPSAALDAGRGRGLKAEGGRRK